MYRKILFAIDGQINNELEGLLQEVNISKKIKKTSCYCEINVAVECDIESIFSRFIPSPINEILENQITYEMNDLQQFDYFYCSGQIKPDISIQIDIHSYETSTFCPNCNLGLKQKGELIVKGISSRHFTKTFFTPFWREWFVNKSTSQSLLNSNITGLKIINVRNSLGETYQDIFQIKPDTILYNSLVDKCFKVEKKKDSCKCNNYVIFFNEEKLIMKKEFLACLKDFNELNERNCSCKGLYIVSKKMMNILCQSGVKQGKDVFFWPVLFA